MRPALRRLVLLLGVLLVLHAMPRASAGVLVAAPDEHVYFVARLDELASVEPRERDDGVPTGTRADILRTPPGESGRGLIFSFRRRPVPPHLPLRAVIDGPGDVLVAPSFVTTMPSTDPAFARLAVRLETPRDVSGRVFVPNADGTAQVAVEFLVPADAFGADAHGPWLHAVADAAAAHLHAGDAGAAWFRHEQAAAEAALVALGESPTERRTAERRPLEVGVQREFELFSGGRALSENLALDRLLPFSDDVEGDLPISAVPGVTVRDYEWGELIAGLAPARDPLAAFVPADQHGLFFPTFASLLAVADELDGLSAPLGRQLEMRAENAGTRERYEQQLGLPLSDLSRLLGPHLIGSVALTGGDPYFRTGTDVALLFEPTQGRATHAAIAARIHLSLGDAPGVERVSGAVDGVDYTGLRTADRAVCSYVAALDGAVVVTNSLVQLARIVRTANGHEAALGDTPEYTFFRDRYVLGDPAESALLILTDATIRRWCGPRLRIGSSRRARAAAVLSEVTARCIADEALASGTSAAGAALPVPPDVPSLGALSLAASRVHSTSYGNLAFATPIAELDLDFVTPDEAALYERWRQGYERNWRDVFDPIAVRFGVDAAEGAPTHEGRESDTKARAADADADAADADADAARASRSRRLTTDVTVRPLMLGSDYEEYIDLTRGGAIAPRSGDLHPGTLVQYSVAIDPGAVAGLPEVGMLALLVPNVDLFGWIDGSISLSVDDAPILDDLLEAEDPDEIVMTRAGELPVALQVGVRNGLQLAAFLTAMRGLVESSAPGMVTWENREHAGHTYVRIAEAESGRLPDLALSYFAGPENLTLSLSEDIIRRAIDRRVARVAARAAGEPRADESERPWIGEHLGVRVDVPGAFAKILDRSEGWHAAMRAASWANLPILNAWRARFPDQDPSHVHAAWFARRLVCPSGGTYRWNEAWKTMESTAYGHPGAPRQGPKLPPVTARIGHLIVGLTFEDDGLRARVEMDLLEDG